MYDDIYEGLDAMTEAVLYVLAVIASVVLGPFVIIAYFIGRYRRKRREKLHRTSPAAADGGER